MDDLQEALDRCVLGFSGSFPMMDGRNNLPSHVTLSSTLLTSRCSGRKYRGPLKHGLTTSRQWKGLYFDAVSALVSPFAWVGGRCADIAGVGKVLIKSWRKRECRVSFENGVNNLRSVISLSCTRLTASITCDQSWVARLHNLSTFGIIVLVQLLSLRGDATSLGPCCLRLWLCLLARS